MKTNAFITLAFAAMVSACSGNVGRSGNDGSKYLNVQVEDSKMWSLINVESGEMVLTDEFKNPVTEVVNNAFFAKNSENKWDIFTLENTTKPLNESAFDYVFAFNKNGYAIAYMDKHPAVVVDTKGQYVTTIPTNIMPVMAFSDDNLAPFVNSKGDLGFINPNGVIAIPATFESILPFSDGVAIVQTSHNEGKTYSAVIDTKGTKLFEFNSSQYSEVSSFIDGYMLAVQDEQVVLIDKKGDKACKVCDGRSLNGLEVKGKHVIYRDGDFFGVKTTGGDIVVRAKYQRLTFIDGDNLLAKNHNDKLGVINVKGDDAMPFDFSVLSHVGHNRYITKAGSNYSLINEKNKEISKVVFENVETSVSSELNQYTASVISGRAEKLISNLKHMTEMAAEEGTDAPKEIDFSSLKDDNSTLSTSSDDNQAEYNDEYASLREGLIVDNENPFAWLSEREVTAADLVDKSLYEKRVMRNAIYAMHGYKFKDTELIQYFLSYSWYSPQYDDVTPYLSTLEVRNAEFLKRNE